MVDNTKRKLLYLKEIFEEHTDAEHGITMKELQQMYEKKVGTPSSPMTIISDIDALAGYGCDIEYPSGSRKDYRLLNRKDEFTPQEIRLLIDLLQTTAAIPDRDVNSLIEKLGKLCSKHERKEISDKVLVNRPVRTNNTEILASIRTLHQAIERNKQVRFKYFHYDVKKKKDYLSYGEDIRVSPYALIYRDNAYLLLAIPAKKEEFFLYRLSQMEEVTISRADRLHQEQYTEARQEYYTKGYRLCNDKYNFGERSFKPTNITFQAKNELMDEVIARYGVDVITTMDGDGRFFTAEVTEYSMADFRRWASPFHRDVREVLSLSK